MSVFELHKGEISPRQKNSEQVIRMLLVTLEIQTRSEHKPHASNHSRPEDITMATDERGVGGGGLYGNDAEECSAVMSLDAAVYCRVPPALYFIPGKRKKIGLQAVRLE